MMAIGFILMRKLNMTYYVVYNSQGQFFARFITYRRALAWAIRSGMEWTAQIVKEKENTK